MLKNKLVRENRQENQISDYIFQEMGQYSKPVSGQGKRELSRFADAALIGAYPALIGANRRLSAQTKRR